MPFRGRTGARRSGDAGGGLEEIEDSRDPCDEAIVVAHLSWEGPGEGGRDLHGVAAQRVG